jgi:ferric-dicitrate binding protein FerR (iron transport regulator)
MERSDFNQLMERYLKGDVTEQEKGKIEAWLDVMKTRDLGDLELAKDDEDRLFRKITANLENVDEIVKIVPAAQWRHGRQLGIAIAASILIAVASFGFWQIFDTPHSASATTAAVNKMILDDGSIVWLQGDSKIAYHEEKGRRNAELVGDALFEIAKDPSRPFTLKCGPTQIRVVGTSFNVRMQEGSVEIKVLTGKVNFSSAKDEAGVNLIHGQAARYEGNSAAKQFVFDDEDRDRLVEGTEYAMKFDNRPIREVIEKLQKKFNVKITLSNSRVGDCHVTADITDHSLENSVQMISDVLGAEYSIDKKNVMIKGTGCQ